MQGDMEGGKHNTATLGEMCGAVGWGKRAAPTRMPLPYLPGHGKRMWLHWLPEDLGDITKERLEPM